MASKDKKMSATERWAAKNKKKTTAGDMPGSGMAKKAAKALGGRQAKIDAAINGYTINDKKVK